MGAGDLVKENLEAIGLEVTNIDIERITQEELNEFDTVLSIRAFNVLESLKYKNQLLFDFAAQGAHSLCNTIPAEDYKPKKSSPIPFNSRETVLPTNLAAYVF